MGDFNKWKALLVCVNALVCVILLAVDYISRDENFPLFSGFPLLHGQFGHSRNLYGSAIKNVRGVGMFGVSLLGRLCCYTDDPLRSGFHVESVFYYTTAVRSTSGYLHKIDGGFHEFLNVFNATFLSFTHD